MIGLIVGGLVCLVFGLLIWAMCSPPDPISNIELEMWAEEQMKDSGMTDKEIDDYQNHRLGEGSANDTFYSYTHAISGRIYHTQKQNVPRRNASEISTRQIVRKQ